MAFWSVPDMPGLAESNERLAEPGCVVEGVDLQDWDMPQLTPCPQCGLPAEIRERFRLQSTDGPVDHVAVGCVDGHHFRMAEDRLPAAPVAQSRGSIRSARHDMGVANDLVVAIPSTTERPSVTVPAGNAAAGGPIASGG
jgi:hypothetical protein